MKRRTFLTGIGGGVSSLGMISLAKSDSCSAPNLSHGAIVQSVVQEKITIELDGFTVDAISWEEVNNKIVGKVTVRKECGVNTEEIQMPDDAESYVEVCLQAISDTKSTVFGRIVQNQEGEWVVLYANTD